MIYLKCQCGSGLGVPGSFLGERIHCDECGRALRLVAAREVTDGRAVQWQLCVAGGPAASAKKGELVLLGGEAPIDAGSEDGRLLHLPGTLVSRAHCRFVPVADGWGIEDTDSRNGTYVNGTRVARHELRAGDLIDVGEWTLEFGPVGPPAVKPPRPAAMRPPAEFAPPPPPLPLARATPSPIPLAAHAAGGRATSSPVVASREPLYEVAPPPPANDDFVEGFGDEYEMVEIPPEPRPRFASARQAPATYGRHPDVPMAQHAGAGMSGGPTCPGCRRQLGRTARICVDCGIHVNTGRPLLTAHGLDEDALQIRAENTIRLVSWAVPFFICPVASEARGHSKPWAIWTIAGITFLSSLMFYVMSFSAPPGRQPPGADLMLWAGDRAAAEEHALWVQEKITEVEQDPEISPSDLAKLQELKEEASRPPLSFQPHQLFTHALLHGGLAHIAGNFVFLFVLGMRVNQLIGNLRTAIIYPLLAIGGGLAHLIASNDEPATPMIGASGAIMGLAGMYLVLFPAYKVHMAIWLRFLLTGFRLFWTTFAVRGFWVVLFYIAFDVIATVFGSEDNVAHWAHLGGFLTGVAIALVLLFTRNVNAYGGDLLSVTLGKYAWPLLGRPGQRRQTPSRSQAVAAAAATA